MPLQAGQGSGTGLGADVREMSGCSLARVLLAGQVRRCCARETAPARLLGPSTLQKEYPAVSLVVPGGRDPWPAQLAAVQQVMGAWLRRCSAGRRLCGTLPAIHLLVPAAAQTSCESLQTRPASAADFLSDGWLTLSWPSNSCRHVLQIKAALVRHQATGKQPGKTWLWPFMELLVAYAQTGGDRFGRVH